MVRTRSVAAAAVSVSVVTGLVVAAILAPSAPGAANPAVHWATGSGHQDDVDVATGEVFNRTFSFSAVQYADGTTAGNAQVASRKFQLDGRELVIHMRIDCLSVLADGKTAQLSGVITRTSFPFAEAPVGEVHRFTVQDNGEPGVGVDKFSGVPPNPLARDCDDADFGQPAPERVAPTRTVNRGNIQVRWADHADRAAWAELAAATPVEVVGEYRLSVVFDDGLSGEIDAIEQAEAELAAIEQELADQSAWNDPRSATKSTKRHAAAKARVEALYAELETVAG